MAVASAMGRQRAGATRCSGQHGHGHRRRPVGKGVHAAKSIFVCLFVCLFVCILFEGFFPFAVGWARVRIALR
jgi:hypothetical protein